MGSGCPSKVGRVSATVGRSLFPNLTLSIRGGDGRAREAVEDNIGVARDEESTAGTEVALIIFALLSVRFAAENDAGGDAIERWFVGDRVMAGGVRESAGLVGCGDKYLGIALLDLGGLMGGGDLFCSLVICACDAQIAATAVTCPPRPPRAERTS